MLVGFKRRFGLWVWEGSKTHTIRADRADGKTPRVGETLYTLRFQAKESHW